ncbi:MAG: TIGR02646 family protein [Alteromonadaceae bacterium TMED7]|uniref:TIGR02646 family protein n=1 Tax=Alteromonas alba TaxID=2079529 RepID=A0A2S9V9W4_9ALTE|nr:retron system putative HNH endonuclease [Alteromonas alba]MAJ71100.1 TIGR02646 family protein [Alteromonadaceae bacterium]PRO73251.1 TIGR02646 family protein [Alteromonas alba]RPH17927.1 MAG: TIGR02646 family protein [Alteromonadaceae bacterium TMED7]|tara:strand:+ start:5317 stop:6084 length:768 start_codon:yes stop_codon:yes gene_type:complete
MKKVLKGAEPELLEAYRNSNSANTWVQFKRVAARKEAVSAQLKHDQAGLCAYCEIKLLPKTHEGEADFRVEHFHPKSDTTIAHNWHLDWQNLLGCCHGGSQKNIVEEADRFGNGDHSCDVPKGNKDLGAIILNPLHLPAFPALFAAERSTCKLKVNVHNCQSATISAAKAAATISELRLDSARLNRFRKTLLDEINRQLTQLIQTGLSVEAARTKLARILLNKDTQQHWPAFFTSVRSYLGSEAEVHLHNIDYAG